MNEIIFMVHEPPEGGYAAEAPGHSIYTGGVKLPRDLSGAELVKILARLGYAETRQTGSHREHHIAVPLKRTLPLGTLRSILRDIARHRGRDIEALAGDLFS